MRVDPLGERGAGSILARQRPTAAFRDASFAADVHGVVNGGEEDRDQGHAEQSLHAFSDHDDSELWCEQLDDDEYAFAKLKRCGPEMQVSITEFLGKATGVSESDYRLQIMELEAKREGFLQAFSLAVALS